MAAKILFSEKRIEVFRKRFSVYDKNNDGTITTKELDFAMKAVGQDLTADELAETINDADTNGNGTIDFSEFVTMISQKMKRKKKKYVKAFRNLDKDDNGFLCPDELRQAMLTVDPPMTEEDIKTVIKKTDLNDDGKVDLKEFKRAIKASFFSEDDE